jgi:hypothetical protein
MMIWYLQINDSVNIGNRFVNNGSRSWRRSCCNL